MLPELSKTETNTASDLLILRSTISGSTGSTGCSASPSSGAGRATAASVDLAIPIGR